MPYPDEVHRAQVVARTAAVARVTSNAPRLIHLNGPPGIGKSTLARSYAERHHGVLNLDVDRLRSMIGGSLQHFAEAGEMARDLALTMAATHLRAGHDVIVPQYLGETGQIDRFEAVADASGAQFCEVFLMDSRENSIARFQRREGGEDPWHRQVDEVVNRGGGPAMLAEMHDRILHVIACRHAAIVVPSVYGEIEATYQALCTALGRQATA